MAKYLFIESRDPFDSNDVAFFRDTTRQLAQKGHDVTLFLVMNAVFPARTSPHSEPLSKLSKSGVTVLADTFSLRERAIDDASLAQGIKPAPLDIIIDKMADGTKVIWH